VRHPFLRTLAGTAATPTDPNFKNVTLLLHGDGTNGAQNNTFLDSGPNSLTVTRGGSVTQGTFSPYGDNWSNYFSAVGNRISFSSANINVGAGLLECWVYPITNGGWRAIYSFGPGIDDALYIAPSGTLALYRGGIMVQSATTVPLETWSHVAVSRDSSNNIRVFLNGVASSAATNTYSFNNNSCVISGRLDGLENLVCYISNLRLLVGTALYTSSFTPPSAPLTAISGTQLLTCQSNRFRDNSANNLSATITGSPSVQRFSPFSPTAAYSAATIGGSGYFPGAAGNQLTVNSATVNIGANIFTVECWLYYDGGNWRSWYGVAAGVTYYVHQGNLWIYYGGSVITASGVATSAWTHVAVTRDSSNVLRVFVNGVLSNSVTTTYSYNSNSATIGERNGNGEPFLGYIAGFRLLIGTALYTASFTPPTAPLTAITNTSLLLNFTNAGILDNAMMAVPETVGNAQISTSVKKYGTGSLYFDGTGDWLLVPNTVDIQFLTGNFTVELWAYPTGGSSFRGVVGKGAANTGWAIFIDNTSKWAFTDTTTNYVSSVSISLNTWVHLAFVRSGNTLSLYVDGVSSASSTTGTNFNQTNGLVVGAGRDLSIPYTGYVDDLRITKGVARYTSNFTPPTAAFPDL
jgi:hypothetical protein